jgi:isocitrate dehydrogenase kinase/phosphatase
LVWQHGNNSNDDVLQALDATPEIATFLHQYFARLQRRRNARVIVEKTCANCFRVPFINAVFPEARFVNIVRDGRAVTESAAKRWTASVEYSYLLKKILHVPAVDVPWHSLQFLKNRLHQLRSVEKRLRTWGPRFPGIEEFAQTHSLSATCAKQWVESIEWSRVTLAAMPDKKVFHLRYEDLVRDPGSVVKAMGNWFGEEIAKALPKEVMDRIHSRKKTKVLFDNETNEILQPCLRKLGYI